MGSEPTLLQQARFFLDALRKFPLNQTPPDAYDETIVWAVECMLQHFEQREAAGHGPAQVPGEPAAPPTVLMHKLSLHPGERTELPDGRHVHNGASCAVFIDVVDGVVHVEAPAPQPTPADTADAFNGWLDELQKLCDALQPGPWELDDTDDAELPIRRVLDGIGVAEAASYPSGAFIAASREAVPKLIAKVRELQGQSAHFKLQAEQYHAMYDRLYMAGGVEPEFADSDTLDLIGLLESGEAIVPATRAMLVLELKRLVRLKAHSTAELDHG